MNKKIKSAIQYIVLLIIGGLLVYLSLKRTAVSKEEIYNSFSNVNFFWITVSLVISLLSHFARAYRWNYLLENYNHSVGLFNGTASVLIGYLANYGLPRMGELTRCAVVNKYNKIPIDTSLGTVIAERVVDLFIKFILFLTVIFTKYNDLKNLLNKYILTPLSGKVNMQNILLLGILGVILISILLFINRKKAGAGWFGKFIKIVKNLSQPLLNIHKIKRPIGFWILSFTIWILYFLSMYFCSLSMKSTENLGVYSILVLFLFGTIGVIVTPGGIGAYHFLLTELLLFYSVDKSSAVAFPWIIWGSQFILILILGGLSFILLPIFNQQKK